MNCSCINACDDDFAEMISEKQVKARKTHRCVECRKAINLGDEYYSETVFYDGKKETIRTCLDCKSARDAFFCSWQFGEIWSDLLSEIDSNDGDLSQSSIAGLTPGARAKVCDLIEDYWEEE